MRLACYLSYPQQVKNLSADILHIIDHGYAHLIRCLDPSRVVVTVHDIIPIIAGRGLMYGVTKIRRNWLSELSGSYLKKAGKIIAVSNNTKNDLVTHCACDPDKIEVIPVGVSPIFQLIKTSQAEELRSSLGLPMDETRLILITGDAFYKNHQTSLKVMEKLKDKYSGNLKLVRLGANSPDWKNACQKSGFKDQVICLQNLENKQMPQLYNAVDCLLFPSWYEGFGMPVLEAMACGTPVVTSNAGFLKRRQFT